MNVRRNPNIEQSFYGLAQYQIYLPFERERKKEDYYKIKHMTN